MTACLTDDGATLAELRAAARVRVLTPAEVEQFVSAAWAAGLAQAVQLELLQAGTSASRVNLVAAKGLRSRQWRAPPSERAPPSWISETQRVNFPDAPFDLTSHAVNRYVERFPADAADQPIRDRLAAELATAAPIRERSMAGDEQWRSASGTIFIVKRDGSSGVNGARPVAVTILPAEYPRRLVSRHRRQRRT